MNMEDHGMNRMQELLSSYYGLQDQESRQEQLRNIDSPGFDPKIYVKELLETRGLNDLLTTDDQLIREIKELDTNMQMLVYENYNKFISATDTIRKMKNNVASMEGEVGRVVKSMDTITAKSESINVALAPHRSKVEKLIGRLNTAVKQKEYANATKYYLLARRILGRYEHISSFKAIQLEAEKIIQQLERLLKKRMLDTTLESEELCETVVLLHQLDACNDEIRDQFLEWHQAYFERAIVVFKGSTEEVLDTLQDDDLSVDIVESEYFVFMRVMKYFVSCVKEVDTTIPMCGLAANATEIVENCVRFQIEGVFRKLQLSAEGIAALQAETSADVLAPCGLAMQELLPLRLAFSEWVRTLELSKFGLQQVQLNAEFLRSTLMHIVVAGEAEEEVENLLSDLLSNARARSVEDILMDQSNVVAILW
eukprot:jgi/Phyca11/20507/fgenesh1_pg.PHYCAscaffold_65_\